MLIDEKTGDILAEGIQWQNGNISMNLRSAAAGNRSPYIELKNFTGLNTQVNVNKGATQISTNLDKISFSKFEMNPGNRPLLKNFFAAGTQLKINNTNALVSAGNYSITDNDVSTFNQFIFKKNTAGLQADISSSAVTIVPHINSLIQENINLGVLNMVKPVINLSVMPDALNKNKEQTQFLRIDIDKIILDHPKISFSRSTDSSNLSFNWQGDIHPADYLHLNGLHIINDSIAAASLSNAQFHLSHFTYKGANEKEFNAADGEFAANLENISAEQDSLQKWNWKGTVIKLDGKNLVAGNWGKQKGNLQLESFNVKDITVAAGYFKKLKDIVRRNPGMSFQQVTGHYTDSIKNIDWYNASFNKINGLFRLDSISYIPATSKETFIASQSYQNDYFKGKTGKISLKGFDADKWLADDVLTIESIHVDNAFFDDFRDKRLPRKPGEIKLLPAAIIKKISSNTSIDTIHFTNGHVVYAELNDKTGKTGTIPITKMNLLIYPVKNFRLAENDSLYISAEGYILDSVYTRLRFHQSYTEPLGGFLLTANLSAGDATIFNPVLIPLASAKLKSGYLDTMSMRATGNDYVATGDIKMLYHDFKISILLNGNEEKKTLKTRVISFIANTFLVKNKNTSKTTALFFERLRDRSLMNYIVKIFVSGVTSSTGVTKSKKMRKKYSATLKKIGKDAEEPQ